MSSADASSTPSLADQVYEELRGRTSQAEAITSGELSDRLNVGDGEANPKTRELIHDVMRERDLPVIAGHSGYYVAGSLKEVEEYLDDLDGRIAGIEGRKRDLVAAYNRRRYSGEDE